MNKILVLSFLFACAANIGWSQNPQINTGIEPKIEGEELEVRLAGINNIFVQGSETLKTAASRHIGYYSQQSDSLLFSDIPVVVASVESAIGMVSPDTGILGTTLDITVSGQFTHFASGFVSGSASWVFWLGISQQPIFPNSTNILNDVSIHANITIPPDVQTGYYNVFTNDAFDGQLEQLNGFYVKVPTGIETFGHNFSGVSVFPDPANENVCLSMNAQYLQRVTINILDISGKLVYSREENCVGNEKYTFDVTGYSSGIYCLDLITEDETLRKKFIVQH
jgi:hypothetical protein